MLLAEMTVPLLAFNNTPAPTLGKAAPLALSPIRLLVITLANVPAPCTDTPSFALPLIWLPMTRLLLAPEPIQTPTPMLATA